MITQREFFNSMADRWDAFCHHDKNKIKYILSLLNIQSGSRILDIGTGTGILIPFLAEYAGEQGEVTAIDYSEKMIEIARYKYSYSNVSFVCDDVLKADLPKEYFDYAICYSVFPHLGDKRSAIKVIGEYLKKGGKFLICHSQSRNAINNIHKKVSAAVAEDDLPDIAVIKGYFRNFNYKIAVEIDNNEMFVVLAIK